MLGDLSEEQIPVVQEVVLSDSTKRLQCSSFLVMTYFLLTDYSLLPKKELHLSLWVC